MHTSFAAGALVALFGSTMLAQAPAPGATDPDGAPPGTIVETWDAPRRVAAGGPQLRPAVAVRFLSTDQNPEGDMPTDLAFTPDGSTVLIANRDTDTVTFLDVATRTIVATVAVGDFPVDVDVSPDGLWAAVPNVFDNTVSILNVATRTVAATVPVTGLQPYAVHMTPDSQFAVVGVINNAVNSALSVISLASLTEVRSIPTGSQGVMGGFATPERGISGNIFTQFAVAPDSVTVVLPDRPNSRVALYDLTTGAQLAVLGTPGLPTAVDIDILGIAAVTHEGTNRAISRIDVPNRVLAGPPLVLAQTLENQVVALTLGGQFAMAAILNSLIFVDMNTGAVTATIATGTVGDIEVSFDGQFAFVSNANARVIALASQTLVATIPAEPGVEAAMSPVAHRAVMLDNRFYENAVVFATNGATSSLLGSVRSGPPAEGDATRTLAISPDGRTIVAANIVSGNVSIVDAATETVRAWLDTGVRVWGAAITPDGAWAVVTNTDADTVSIVNLGTDTVAATLSVPSRPTEVEIAPDGSRAYVTTIAGTDRLAEIALNGALSSVVRSTVIGQLGTLQYTYGVSSGIDLSPDGSLLAICVSFDDRLKLYDTASGTIVSNLLVGDFPVQAAFSADGSRLYVVNAFTDDLTVILVAGAASFVQGTVPGLEFPRTVDVDPSGAFVYVGCFDFATPRVSVVDTASLAVVRNVLLPSTPYATVYSATDDVLYVAATGGQLVRVAASGSTSSVIDITTLVGGPADLVFSESLRRAYTAQPGTQDGMDVVAYGGVFTHYGPSLAGTGGITPVIEGAGVPTPGAAVTIDVTQGLGNAPGLLMIGFQQVSVPVFGGTLLLVPYQSYFHFLSPGGTYAQGLVIPPDPIFLGVDAFLQSAYADVGAPGGVSHTDGLVMAIR